MESVPQNIKRLLCTTLPCVQPSPAQPTMQDTPDSKKKKKRKKKRRMSEKNEMTG
jgi:hypothetical protein